MKKFLYTIIMLVMSVVVVSQIREFKNQTFVNFLSNYLPADNQSRIKQPESIPSVTKTINVSTAGSLKNLITDEENSTLTDITITGNIDARDFKFLRESLPLLRNLNLENSHIQSYSGSEGPSSTSLVNYPANEIPEFSFCNPDNLNAKFLLESFVFPTTAISIGEGAFAFCTGLHSINIPSTIASIEYLSFVGSGALIQVDTANPVFSGMDGILYNKARTTLIHCPASVSGNLTLPATVDSITIAAFFLCDKLSTINISSYVLSIGEFAFTGCSGVINVDETNPNYASQEGVLFNKSKTSLFQCPSSKVGNYIIPFTVTDINDNSFYNCSLLESVSIPASVVNIGYGAFYNCSGLTSITVNNMPVSLSSSHNVFFGVNFNTCILNVPFGTKVFYQSASGWSSFINIIENPHGLILSSNNLILSSISGSRGSVVITSNQLWAVSSEQNWLQVSPQNGMGNDTIIFTAEANTSIANRTAVVTVSSEGVEPQIIQVTQSGQPITINLTPGGLAASMTAEELTTTLNLKITGTIDARDFKTMRDNMPKLTFLDLSEVDIAAYNGGDGPASWINAYPAGAIPDYSFNPEISSQNITLTGIILPQNITKIGINAFYSCIYLSDIIIPNSVTYIGSGAFGSCKSLTNITLPVNLTSIENSAFQGCGISTINIPNKVKSIATYGFAYCKNLREVFISDSVTTISNSAFEECVLLSELVIGKSVASIRNSAFSGCASLTHVTIPNSVTILDGFAFASCINLKSVTLSNSLSTIGYYSFYQCKKLTGIVIPSSVTKIDYSAFNSSGLTDITIPATVISIKYSAFSNCTSLKSVTLEMETPIDLTSSSGVFFGVDMNSCILNVPFGTKDTYLTAYQWKDFVNIVENVHGFILSSNSVKLSAVEGCTTSIALTSNDQWTTASSQTWLNVIPDSGVGSDTIKLIAEVNLSSLQRMAMVTVTSGDISKVITVVQAAAPKILNITAGGLAAALTVEELNSITDLIVTGTIDARDFKIMRDKMPHLENLDINAVDILVYTGSDGTYGSYSYAYAANEVPKYAFFSSTTYTGKASLSNVKLPVTAKSIGESAFQSCPGLTAIIIPDSVTSIGSSAFKNCKGLSDVVMPNSLITIGDRAFENCTALGNVIMPDSLKSIGDYAFEYTNITELSIPESVTSIGYSSFSNCTMLNQVLLPNSLTTINNSAFSNCSGLKKVVMGNAVTTIKYSAFYYCTSLTGIVIPETVISIEGSAFANCSGLLSITSNLLTPLDLSNSSGVFYGVDKAKCILNVPLQTGSLYSAADQWKDFENIVENPYGLVLDMYAARIAPKAASSVGVNVISNTNWEVTSDKSWLTLSSTSGSGDKLITLTAEENISYSSRIAIVTVSASNLPDKKITITQVARAKILEVTAGGLSASLSSAELNTISNLVLTGTIDARDFKIMRNMPALTDLDISLTTIVAYTGNEGTYGTFNYTYPATTIPQNAFFNIYTNGAKNNMISIVLPNSAESIGANSFKNCRDLFFVKFPETLRVIGDNAFESCSGFTDITLPNSLLSIGNYAFSNCKGLKSLKLGESVSTINSRAFEYCSALKSVKLPDSVTTLGDYVFNYCTALIDFSFGNSLKSTGNSTFSNCIALESIVIPNNITTIGSSVFSWCSNLNHVTFGNSITAIGSSAFGFCSKLDTIVIPNTVTSLGFRAFMDCSELKSITLSNLLTTIGGELFFSCGKLTDITIPNSVTTIESGAFTYCSSLKNISFGSSLRTIGGGAFSNCYGLIDVVLPNRVETIDIYAFSGCNGMKSITIPAGIGYLGYSSISGSGLSAIYSLAQVPLTPTSNDIFNYVNKSTCILYVPQGAKDAYRSTAQWKDFVNIVEMTTAVPVLNHPQIRISPNPVYESFKISGVDGLSIVSFIDLNGKTVSTKHVYGDEEINVNELSKGSYIIRIINDEIIIKQKIIKE